MNRHTGTRLSSFTFENMHRSTHFLWEQTDIEKFHQAAIEIQKYDQIHNKTTNISYKERRHSMFSTTLSQFPTLCYFAIVLVVTTT
jgi:hypothetical protein